MAKKTLKEKAERAFEAEIIRATLLSPLIICRMCHRISTGSTSYELDLHVCSGCAEDISREYVSTHGIKLLGLDPTPRKPIPENVRWSIFERDNFTCQKCGATGVPLAVDHRFALANGGPDDVSNYWTLCRSCNCSKGARA